MSADSLLDDGVWQGQIHSGGWVAAHGGDMPIVEPASFEALGLVPFQINPHYLDPDPGSTHMGETREQRIREFHEENEAPVVGIREGAWIRVEGDHATLGGSRGARLFRRGQEPEERGTGKLLDDLMQAFPQS